MVRLSERLKLIADEIIEGETMADIGTDHGFLPIYLWETGKCPHVIMTDVSRGSLDKALADCGVEHPDEKFDLRLGDGLKVIGQGEVDDIVIAGMGGLLIGDIIEDDLTKSRSYKRFILQPRNNIGRLRNRLRTLGFMVTRESLVREGRFIWEILTVEPDPVNQGEVREYSACDDFPDTLAEFRNPLTAEYLEKKLALEEKILGNIRNNSRDAEKEAEFTIERIVQLRKLITAMEVTK